MWSPFTMGKHTRNLGAVVFCIGSIGSCAVVVLHPDYLEPCGHLI
jgi:hypothetical protein